MYVPQHNRRHGHVHVLYQGLEVLSLLEPRLYSEHVYK